MHAFISRRKPKQQKKKCGEVFLKKRYRVFGAMLFNKGTSVRLPNNEHNNATPYPVARSPCRKKKKR